MSFAVKAFTGSSVEEVEAQARAELGDDVRIVDRRERLEGGIGGFFQKRIVEVLAVGGLSEQPADAEAREPRPTAARARIDAYAPSEVTTYEDLGGYERLRPGEVAVPPPLPPAPREPEPTAEAEPEPVELFDPARDAPAYDFDRALSDLVAAPSPASPPQQPAPPSPVPELVTPVAAEERWATTVSRRGAQAAVRLLADELRREGVAADVAAELLAAGVDADLAADVLAEVEEHGRALAVTSDTRELVRTALARRVRTLPLARLGTRGTIVVAGGPRSGRSSLVAALVRAYGAAGRAVSAVAVAAASDEGAERVREAARAVGAGYERLETLARPSPGMYDGGALVIVDAPALDDGDAPLAQLRAAVGARAALVAVPADEPLERQLAVTRLAGRGTAALAVTKLDAGPGPGVLVALAAAQRLPLALATRSGEGGTGVTALDPTTVARLVLP